MDNETWEQYSHYHSKSRLSLFSYCPLKYRKQYIDKTAPRDSNYALAVGSRIHEFFDKFFDIAEQYEPCDWEQFIHEDFAPYEHRMIKWFIDSERERLEMLNFNYNEWRPVVHEEKFINNEYKIRGIIDRIDCIDNETFLLVEYKTSKSIYKPSLQGEFGFYSLLLQEDPRFRNAKFLGCVINPRLQKIEFMAPSRHSTIIKRLEKLNYAIDTLTFEPFCSEAKYAMCNGLCDIDESKLYVPKESIKYVDGLEYATA